MSENTIILCTVLAVVTVVAALFIHRACRYRNACKTVVTPEEKHSEQSTKQDIYMFRFVYPERGIFATRKTIRVREEYYDRIRAIIQTIGDNEITLIAYLDNVLKAHFDDNRDVINALYREKTDKQINRSE